MCTDRRIGSLYRRVPIHESSMGRRFVLGMLADSHQPTFELPANGYASPSI
jgi:hypothetical protein